MRGGPPILALAAALLALGGAAHAVETAEDFTATLTGGETQISSNNVVNNMPTGDNSDTPWMVTTGVRVGARFRLLGARSVNSLGYTFTLLRFFNLPDKPPPGFQLARYTTTHEAVLLSDQTLNARHRVVFNLNGSVYTLAGLPIGAVATTTGATGTPAINTDTHLLSIGAGETWVYEPTASHRLIQVLTVGYLRPLDDMPVFPETLQLLFTERGERQQGTTIYSLTAQVGDQIRLDTPATQTTGTFTGTNVYTAQLLAGLGREIWPTTRIEARAGVMALYSPGLGTVALGPAGDLSLTYRRNPWYATLIAAHGPTLNGYVASAVVSDSIMLRAALPLNAAETLTISGAGGYAYTRSVTGGSGIGSTFSNTSKLYDAVTLAGYASYQFTQAMSVALEFSVIDQRGYATADAFAPSIRRRYLGIAMSGNLSTDRRPAPQATVR